MNELLYKANEYIKNRQHKKAINIFNELKELNYEFTLEDCLNYAKSLRIGGETTSSKTILKEALNKFPKSESLLKESLNLYDHLEEWGSSKKVARKLVEINPFDYSNYFSLGKSYVYLKENSKAAECYKKGIAMNHGLTYEELVNKINRMVTDDASNVKTKYVFLNGKNNLGAFIHSIGDKKYFTKISKVNINSKNEDIFYSELCYEFPELEKVTPKFINSQKLDNVHYLTMEYIEGSSSKQRIEDVINALNIYSKLDYKKLIEKFPNNDYKFSSKMRVTFLPFYFTNIHKESYNKKLFTNLKIFFKQKRFPEELYEILYYLEKKILNNKLYGQIKPLEHYTLMHSDFKPNNIIIDNKTGKVNIYDWATFKIGPHFIDFARYSAIAFTPFLIVKELYLYKSNPSLTEIEKVFFLYAYILFHIVNLHNNWSKYESILLDFIYPAMLEFDSLLNHYEPNHQDIASILSKLSIGTGQSLNKQNKILLRENKELKRTNASLNKKYKNTEKKYKNVTNSKSWKVTAPIRKLMNKKRNN